MPPRKRNKSRDSNASRRTQKKVDKCAREQGKRCGRWWCVFTRQVVLLHEAISTRSTWPHHLEVVADACWVQSDVFLSYWNSLLICADLVAQWEIADRKIPWRRSCGLDGSIWQRHCNIVEGTDRVERQWRARRGARSYFERGDKTALVHKTTLAQTVRTAFDKQKTTAAHVSLGAWVVQRLLVLHVQGARHEW